MLCSVGVFGDQGMNGDSRLSASDLMHSAEDFNESANKLFHSLMKFRVRRLLLVSSLYDAFIVEQEGLIAELIMGEYRHLFLSSAPEITRVNGGKQALDALKTGEFDLVITMSKNIGMNPYDFGKKVKRKHHDLPVVLLATEASDLRMCESHESDVGIDKVFFWTGDPTLFIAIIKHIEDQKNALNDTKTGNVRVIIMVEDSIRYYSKFLPIIYTQIVLQIQRSLSEDLNEMQMQLRRRARPRILLAETYEEAVELYDKYQEYVLGIISDIQFKKEGKMVGDAGFVFANYVQKKYAYTPVLLQSTVSRNREKSKSEGFYFLDKNSQHLVKDFEKFLLKMLGFGDFVFLMPKPLGSKEKEPGIFDVERMETVEVARAADIKEFEELLPRIPQSSIEYHAKRNHFSNWLMARGEFKLGKNLRKLKAQQFSGSEELRQFLIDFLKESRRKKQASILTDFSQQTFEFDGAFTRIREDSLGGKGRGIAFIRSLLARYNLKKKYPGVRITVPNTVAVGILEFDQFLQNNNISAFLDEQQYSDEQIAEVFVEGKLTEDLKKRLAKMLRYYRGPLAVRSSSLLEDSQSTPFAGMYSTYMLPNSHPVEDVRLEQLCTAIKLIYASVFFEEPRSFIKSTGSKIDQEKMGIIIQEVAGSSHKDMFYPTFSGVAQSYNFYPVGHQEAEDGIVTVAAGLGRSVVGGERSIRFCPRYPELIPEFASPDLVLQSAQQRVYVLDMSDEQKKVSFREDSTLLHVRVKEVVDDTNIRFLVSSYDRDDGIIRDGVYEGMRPLVTFSGVLKNDVFPLGPLITDILMIGEYGMGCPVEIEFAVDLRADDAKEKPVFYLLQIRPFVISQHGCDLGYGDVPKQDIFLQSKKALGNGFFEQISDIVYIPPNRFDVAKTFEMSLEVGKINSALSKENREYVLMGPGRWGTEDRWLGVPVRWNQISSAKIIVETEMQGFLVKPSQGTHFFHNLISRGIGYVDIPVEDEESFIDYEWLDSLEAENDFEFVRHVHLKKPLKICFNGKLKTATMLKPDSLAERVEF